MFCPMKKISSTAPRFSVDVGFFQTDIYSIRKEKFTEIKFFH